MQTKKKIIKKTQEQIEKEERLKEEVKLKFVQDQKLEHHLFKLGLAEMLKNVGTDDKPRYEQAEHVHFYHSIDSNGKTQTSSCPVGGHSHDVTYSIDEEGNVSASCGPAKYKRAVKYRNSQGQLVEDNHSHEIIYIGSQVIERRKSNRDAVRMIEQERALDARLDGLQ